MGPKLLLLLVASLTPGVASAAQSDEQRPELFKALERCRDIADSALRLQCYDGAAAALAQAADRKEVIVVDRRQMRETRRRLFGLTIPSLPFFDNDDDKSEDAVRSIEGIIAAASDARGTWTIRLQDGAVWTQTDNHALALFPKAGQKVEIRRGALGSYMMRVNGQPGIRVKRSS